VAHGIKTRAEKLNCIKLKSFCTPKETVIRIRKQHKD
jgi:hypothetical protein